MSVAGVSNTDFGFGLGLGCLRDQTKFSNRWSGETTLSLGLGPSNYPDKTCQLEADKSTESSDLLHQQSSSTPRASDEDEVGCPRKKLRLQKEQAAVLEESFREHTTLNPRQKQELARKLNLQARQVEVWFQNRRARTKLKQTEVDCQVLKKCCEKLAEENKRLHKELQQLKLWKLTEANSQTCCMQLPATVCPSCESPPFPSNTTTSAGSKVQRHPYNKA